MSIRAKITLWFAAMMILLAGLTLGCVWLISDNVVQNNLKDTLIETVSSNLDEVEFYQLKQDANIDHDLDLYIQYQGGFLEIDDDYLDRMNGIYTTLYDGNHSLIYGEDPIGVESYDLGFKDGQIQEIKVNNVTYYIYDHSLAGEGLDDLWLRGVVSSKQGGRWMDSIVVFSIGLVPVLVILSLIGGYFLAGRFLRPIQNMIRSANEIQYGRDLKKRIDIGKGHDELHQLADTYNAMINRLDHAFQAEKQFTSDMSHELRTPVSVILSQCELALEDEQDKEEYIEAIELIQRQGNKMSDMINDMLQMTRMEQRKDHIQLEEINFSELCTVVCKDMQLLKEQNITLSWNIHNNIYINGNKELLRRLLMNLIYNAYRYGRENGHIHVTLQENAEEVKLCVQDDGIGIPQEKIPFIWKRFYQIDSSRSVKGSGLGLAMVEEIAQLHQGYMEVESEVNVGSNFIFHIPKQN